MFDIQTSNEQNDDGPQPQPCDQKSQHEDIEKSIKSRLQQQQQQHTTGYISLPIQEILTHKMFNFKMSPERTIYERSQMYCNLCEYSCELTNKSSIISHYLAKHPLNNIIYNYLWSQLEDNEQAFTTSYKMKYYLVKAHLKIRYKDLANDKHQHEPMALALTAGGIGPVDDDDAIRDLLSTLIGTIESQQQLIQSTDNIQEMEEEQEVHEVNERDLYNQQQTTTDLSPKLNGTNQNGLLNDNQSLLSLFNESTIINKQVKVNQLDGHLLQPIDQLDDTLKQLHESKAACIICAKVDQYDVNHYRDHLDNEYNLNICLKCNHMDGSSSSSAVGTNVACQDDTQTVHMRQHISNHHGQDDGQCVDDVYLNINLKSIKFIDQSAVNTNSFKLDLYNSCGQCTDVNPTQSFTQLLEHIKQAHGHTKLPVYICGHCYICKLDMTGYVSHIVLNHFNKANHQLCVAMLDTDRLSSIKADESTGEHVIEYVNEINGQVHELKTSKKPNIYCLYDDVHFQDDYDFIRHSYGRHLMDPNINLNWYKIYEIDAAPGTRMSDDAIDDDDVDVDQQHSTTIANNNGQEPIRILYECQLCLKKLQTREAINRHLILHSINQQYKYEIKCKKCNLSTLAANNRNLNECLNLNHDLCIGFCTDTTNGQQQQQRLQCSCCMYDVDATRRYEIITHVLYDHFCYNGAIKLLHVLPAEAMQQQQPPPTHLDMTNEQLFGYLNQLSINTEQQFANDQKCILCKYSTKIKANLIKHLYLSHSICFNDKIKGDILKIPEEIIIQEKASAQQQAQQISQQQEECGENLFVFKCNLCDTYSTDDLTQLLDHYKIVHETELSVSDSSILLTAAIAAFQTGHTIEMTGAILNTLSTITNEQGITIINGEEVPVHTTVQYKCTLCYEIFYEKLFIVQHLHDMHQFDVDLSYFEALELQQQEQLQQKLFEQEQEQQLQLVAAVQQQQQQQNDGQQQQQQQQVDIMHMANINTSSTQQQDTNHIMQQQLSQSSVVNNSQQQQHHHHHHQQLQLASTVANSAAMVVHDHSDTSVNVYKCDLCDFRDVNFDVVRKHEKSHFANQVTSTGNNNCGQQNSQAPAQPRYTCTYCYHKMDNLKRISDHIRKTHANKELICMDTYKNQVIRIGDELVLSPTAHAHAIAQQQQQQQQHVIDAQPQVPQAPVQPVAPQTKKQRTHAPNTIKSDIQQQQQQQQLQPSEIVQLFLDANNQLFIDFNENDELQCVYCESVITGLNFMRAHIKYKHKDKKILFRNRKNLKLYSIVNDNLNQTSNMIDSNKIKKELDSGGATVNGILTQQQNFVLNEETIKFYSFLNITLNCHYCWAQFQLNASKNPKENGNNKFMQHLILHLNAPYLCGECLYPVKDHKTFLKHKEFYKHDETAMIAKANKCEMIENKIYKYLINEKTKKNVPIDTANNSQIVSSQTQATVNDSPYKYKCNQCYKYSNEKEDLLKHILIMHLAFLAYKCDLCTFYAFDEMQIKQHGLKVHKINDCKSKLIKTEEEINLALNRANQLIITNEKQVATDQQALTLATSLCDVKPKYKCSKCVQAANTALDQHATIVLYSYSEALEHIIKMHLNATGMQKQMQQQQMQQQINAANKKVCFELELLEENLEGLKDKTTQMAVQIVHQHNNNNNNEEEKIQTNKRKHDQVDADDCQHDNHNDDDIDDDDNNNNNGTTSTNNEWNHTVYDSISNKSFYYRKSLLIKCRLCMRKFNKNPIDHMLLCHSKDKLNLSCAKCKPQVQFACLYEFYFHVKNQHYLKVLKAITDHVAPTPSPPPTTTTTTTSGTNANDTQQLNCFICSAELKAHMNFNEHFIQDHAIDLNDCELNSELSIQMMTYLQTFNLIDIYEYIRPRSGHYNRASLMAATTNVDTELVKLGDLYKQHVNDKSILNWLNLDQFLVRNFNYQSYMCSICASSREAIIKHLPGQQQQPQPQQPHMGVNMHCISALSLEPDDIILCIANHILQHFNEYCYRCIACKISWPDRTQLVKHSLECQNSQVVRTKTKYKLKAQSRVYLQFNLLTMKTFWHNEINNIDRNNRYDNPLACTHKQPYVYLNDLMVNSRVLLNESVNSNLTKIYVDESKTIVFENVTNNGELDDF